MPANAAGVAWYTSDWHTWEPDNAGPSPADDLAARLTIEVAEEGAVRRLPAKVNPVEGFAETYVVAPKGEELKTGASFRFIVDEGSSREGQVLVTIDPGKLSVLFFGEGCPYARIS